MNKKRLVLLLVFGAAVMLTLLWQIGFIGLWQNGMAHIANQPEKYTHEFGHMVQGEYALTIDLSDPESNLGKELYNDGTHRIYVSWVASSGKRDYEIGFRSSGVYSLAGASLVSGVRHETINNGQSFTTTMSAVLSARHANKAFVGTPAGLSGLNYADGDEFSFHIFNSDAYESQEAILRESGTVHLTVTNLYKNIWRKR